MKRRAVRLTFTLVAVAWAAMIACSAAAQYAAAGRTYVPNEYIISVQPGTSRAVVEQAVANMGATLVRALAVDDHYLIRLGRSPGRSSTYTAHGLSGRAARWVVESIQPNYVYRLHAVPNDEHWDRLWNIKQINMPGAWEITKGSSGITVAVIDSGVANHPDLVNRIVPGYDFNENDSDPSNDTDGHGTHVAGIIAAQGNNGIGVCGVCWNGVKIMPLRLFGPNPPTTDIFVDCLDYALTQGAQVVNMSLGQEYDDPTLHAKITQLATAGLVLVASSGNTGDDTLYYPAAYPECISVSAVGPYDAIAPYSSYGKVDIAAPGGDSGLGQEAMVYSTGVTWSNNAPVFDYRYGEGTSMAAPHVSGAAALLLGYNVPSSDVKNRLLAGARPPKSGGMDPVKYGAGILDVQAALANAVLRIVQPGKGATVGTTPDFRISIQGINLATIKVYLDYADINDDGIPDDPNEGIIIDGATVYFYLNAARTAVEFNWTDIFPSTAMTSGTHNIYASADAAAGGGSVSDWCVFTVARKKISRGIHLFAFPYNLADRTVDTPDKLLPGTRYDLGYSPRSRLIRWLASPRSLTDITPVGYDAYNPQNAADRVWFNPISTLGTLSVPTGGGYYYDSVLREWRYAFPAGSGFWLVLPTDVYIDESYSALESLPSFDGSKGFNIPLYKGYNMVGNPYSHAVPWRAALFTYRGQTKTLLDAEMAGWVRSTIYCYAGSSSGYQRVTDRDLLEPFTGYWVLALVGGAGETDSLVLTILP